MSAALPCVRYPEGGDGNYPKSGGLNLAQVVSWEREPTSNELILVTTAPAFDVLGPHLIILDGPFADRVESLLNAAAITFPQFRTEG